MKKYIQLTAGRGPVECARAVTLVARELLKDFPDAELVESEPHNTEPDCYMSMLFLAETDAAKEKEWNDTVLWRATSNRYRPGYSRKNWFVGVRIGLSEWSLSNPLHFLMYPTRILCTKRCAPADMAGRMSIKWRQLSAPLTGRPGFLSNAASNAHSHKTRKRHVACFFSNCNN